MKLLVADGICADELMVSLRLSNCDGFCWENVTAVFWTDRRKDQLANLGLMIWFVVPREPVNAYRYIFPCKKATWHIPKMFRPFLVGLLAAAGVRAFAKGCDGIRACPCHAKNWTVGQALVSFFSTAPTDIEPRLNNCYFWFYQFSLVQIGNTVAEIHRFLSDQMDDATTRFLPHKINFR